MKPGTSKKPGKKKSRLYSGSMCLMDSSRLLATQSERDFLTDCAANARMAISQTLGNIKENLTTMAHVRSCAARHPWILTGSAVAAGVVVGAMLTTFARQKIRITGKTPADLTVETPPAPQEHKTRRAARSFLFSIAAAVLTAVLQPLLQSWFAPAAAAQGESREAPSSSGEPADAVGSESGVDVNAQASGGRAVEGGAGGP